jgi:AcrR family transcriptional regulator
VTAKAAQAKAAVPLSREYITSAAIDFIERRGLEQLSMRALATEIGCGTMSLYSHIRGRDDLTASIVETLLSRSEIPTTAARTFPRWQELITQLHLAYRDLARSYPRTFELLALAPYDIAPVAGYLEGLVEALRRTGLPQERAYEILGALDAYATGFLTVWARTEANRNVSDVAASPHLKGLRSLEVFEHGLQVFIEGFERELERSNETV